MIDNVLPRRERKPNFDPPWSYRFAKMGGYDCMTEAFIIKAGTTPLSPTVAVLDFSDFGQKRGQPASTETQQMAMDIAELIVRAVNAQAGIK